MAKERIKTKEELQLELTKANYQLSQWNEIDADKRKEFGKAFHWFKKKGSWDVGNHAEYIVPTWTEIYVEIGRLLASRTFMDFEGNISELEAKIETLGRELREKNEG